MNLGLIPARYAKALLDFAVSRGEDYAVYETMKSLSKHLTQVPAVLTTLENPVIDKKIKYKLIMTAAGEGACESFVRFVNVCIDNNRENCLYLIALKYRDVYRKNNNIYYCKLTTFMPWKEETLNRLKSIILKGENGKVEFDVIVDKSILGGFIIEHDSLLLDASILCQIKMLNNQLLDKNKKIV